MESPLLGLILDSSVIIAAERKRQTVEQLLTSVGQAFGEIEIAISAVTLAELVHGVARANTPEIRIARRAFIDEPKKHVPVHPVTDSTAEIAGQISPNSISVRTLYWLIVGSTRPKSIWAWWRVWTPFGLHGRSSHRVSGVE